MKIEISKDLTTLAQLEKVKEDVKEFRGIYKPRDFLNAWNERCAERELWSESIHGEVLSAEVTAFPSKWCTDAPTSFGIEIVVDGINEFHKLRFYADIGMEIDDRPDVITHRVYREVKE